METKMKKQSWILVEGNKIEDVLKAEPVAGVRAINPFASWARGIGFPLIVLEDHAVLKARAEVHTTKGDLWLSLEGESTFELGGELVDPSFGKLPNGDEDKTEISSEEIKGGEKVVMKPGDWLWIPPGVPHKHFCGGTARLVIIKIPN